MNNSLAVTSKIKNKTKVLLADFAIVAASLLCVIPSSAAETDLDNTTVRGPGNPSTSTTSKMPDVPATQSFVIYADLGVTHYLPAPNGNWYQEENPYTLRMNALGGTISLYTDPSKQWQFGGGIGNAGRVTSDAMVYDVDNCTPATNGKGALVNGRFVATQYGCGPLSHMQGSGSTALSFLGVRRNFKNFWVGTEIYETKMTYQNTNYDWYNWQHPTTPVVSHIEHQATWLPGFGISAGYKISEHFSFVVKIIPTKDMTCQTTSDPNNPKQCYRPVESPSVEHSPNLSVEYRF